ncbi:MAG: amino acid permease [Myxococcota bacterium]
MDDLPHSERPADGPVAFLGLPSGVGLVMATMIGAGVFLSAGFMAQELNPRWIMTAWVVGAVLALAGARTYAEASILIPRSGGEYRYLSDLVHPVAGYLAGWASLLMGFAAPAAISAYGAAAFILAMLGVTDVDVRAVATILLVVLVVVHAARLGVSKWTQNALVSMSVLAILSFILAGWVLGSHSWPSWSAPASTGRFEALPFATSLFYVAYAFTGWNAAAYAADEFRTPRRDVPLAMMIGCAVVGVLYLMTNWVFVANLTPEQAAAVFEYEQTRVTLGHLVAEQLLGAHGSQWMSAVVALAMLSSVSAMLLVGPRVYAVMATDGFLPSVLRGTQGSPPRASVVVQGLISLALLHAHSVGELLTNVAGVLIVFSSLVALGLFLASRRRPDLPRPRRTALAAALLYVVSSGWMLYNAFKARTGLLSWLLLIGVAGLGAYLWTVRRRRQR